MGGVDEAEQGTYGNGLHALGFQPAHHLAGLFLVQRGFNVAVVADALGHGAVQAGGNQRIGLLRLQVVQRGAALGADLHQVLKALGGDEAQAAALFLDKGVGAHGGAVRQIADGFRPSLFDFQYVLYALHDGPGRVCRGGTVLVVEQFAGFLIEHGEIRKGSSYVNADHITHGCFTSLIC